MNIEITSRNFKSSDNLLLLIKNKVKKIEKFGAKIIKAKTLLHGKTSNILHNEKGIYKNIKNPFEATRYHSLIVDKKTLSNDFIITAKTKDGIIMGIKHKFYDLEGVQFHPESILTKEGKKLIKNILKNKT